MKPRYILAMLIFSLAVGLQPQAHAQLGCDPIAYGGTATGTINNSVWGFDYCFSGAAGDTVFINMDATSGNLDTYMILSDSNGNFLIDDDDSLQLPNANTTNSYIEFTLPATGSYTIYAGRFSTNTGQTTGNYTLSLSALSSPPPGSVDSDGDGFSDNADACPSVIGVAPDGCPAQPGGQAGGTSAVCRNAILIGYGQPAGGTIDNTQTDFLWCFSGTAGDRVEISMTASPGSNLDTHLTLLDANSQFLIDNDDVTFQTTDSFIEFTLPVTGDYGIIASRFGFAGGSTFGDYDLGVVLAGGQPGTGTGTGTGQTGGDTDGDGVPDNVDVCPTQGAGIYGIEPGGCPINDPADACALMARTGVADCADNDNDGFPNDFDLCPADAGVAPNGCPTAPTVTLPTSASGGIQIVCDNGQTISNGVMVTVNMRAGFDYTATAVGVNGFDPVLGVVNADGRALCNDDDQRASEYSFTLPTTGRVNASPLNSRVSFTFGQRGAGYGNVQLVVGGFGNTAGEYVLFLEGMVVTDGDGAGDPFELELTQNLLNYTAQPVIYMIGVEASLDPFITVLDEQYNPFLDPSNRVVFCDDGGNFNTCWNSGSAMQGASITTSPRRTLPADSLDASLLVPTTAGINPSQINFLMTSLGQQSLGEYILAFHMGTQ